jgi:porin
MKAVALTSILALLMCEACFSATAFAQDEEEPAQAQQDPEEPAQAQQDPEEPAQAQQDEEEPAQAQEVAEEAKPQGLLPVPDYSGDLWTRSYLTGDWWGTRDTLAEAGIQLNAEYYQYFQDVVDGGVEGGSKYGGRANYTLHVDLAKMGVTSGLIYARVDSRWGDSVNGRTGQLLPANEAFLIPVDYSDLEKDTFGALTALNYTHFVSPKFAVFGGKLDNMDGDPNEFAGGRGDTQFLNYSLMFAAPTAIVPASTLGAGVLFMPNKHVTIASQFSSATDISFHSFANAFDDWDQGQIWATSVMTQYRIGDLPGGFNASYLQWFNAEFTNLGSRAGPLSSLEDESWLVALSAWQYVYTEESSEGPLDPTNKIPDLQGLGLFARIGIADEDTNPFKFNLSVGLGGRGLIPGRDNDLFGLGYFYNETESGNLLDDIGLEQSLNGFEAFYNLEVTPSTRLSLDVQWLQAVVPDTDDAVVLGARLQIRF